MRTLKFSLFVGILALIASCNKGGVFCYKEDGNLTTETRDVSTFTEVALCTQGNVYVEYADQYSVEVETSSNLQEIITTKVKNNTLQIETKKGKCIKGDPIINIYVKGPSIRGLEISGSGNIYMEDFREESSMDLEISGSGDIYVDSLQTSTLNSKISGSGSIQVIGTGTISQQEIKISGSGDINTLNAPANHTTVKISGSGSSTIHALQTLDVNISGSGDVIYMGTPTITSNISGSGNVRPY